LISTVISANGVQDFSWCLTPRVNQRSYVIFSYVRILKQSCKTESVDSAYCFRV